MPAELEFVSLGASPRTTAGVLSTIALRTPTHTVDEALQLARTLGAEQRHPAPPTTPGRATRDLWEALATIAAHDLVAVRVIEPHLDALAILEQAGIAHLDGWGYDSTVADFTWGVFAAEGGDDPLIAAAGTNETSAIEPSAKTEAQDADGWQLTGTKPWCSLADRLDAALVTAKTDGGDRRIFAVRLDDPAIEVHEGVWHARGLVEIPSGPVTFSRVSAVAVGDAGWYLSRPGFAWGGIGVAACWYGGAVGLARTLFYAARRSLADSFLSMHLGAVDSVLEDARRALWEAAQIIDAGSSSGADGKTLAKRVRATVARSCEEVLMRVGHALGPAPLALDPVHAKRVADLELYIRQHHAERDDAALGSSLSSEENAPW